MRNRELTVAQKWAEVDRMLDAINSRRARNERPCHTYLESYVDKQFNKGHNAKS